MLLIQLHGPLLRDASLLTQILTVLGAALLLLSNPHLLLWLRQSLLGPLRFRLLLWARRVSTLLVVLLVVWLPLLLLIVVLVVILPLATGRKTRSGYRQNTDCHRQKHSVHILNSHRTLLENPSSTRKCRYSSSTSDITDTFSPTLCRIEPHGKEL
jgi:hypothetical protein